SRGSIFTASYRDGSSEAPLQLSTTPSPSDTRSKCAPTMMTLSELPGSKQMTLGSFDPFTGCSEMCCPSQPASVNICFSVDSRCLLSPAYFLRRASTALRETRLYRRFSAVAVIEAFSNNTVAATALSVDH